ncbi:PilT/PilU family type 4a pilus ATPase [Sanguibacter sp. A247]|uniref:PilT/PilU family type 4a pilus ATPase n=1 Tax=unclassified Sanguibacter TaxID=2645534 RepID=UPI003FD7932D
MNDTMPPSDSRWTAQGFPGRSDAGSAAAQWAPSGAGAAGVAPPPSAASAFAVGMGRVEAPAAAPVVQRTPVASFLPDGVAPAAPPQEMRRAPEAVSPMKPTMSSSAPTGAPGGAPASWSQPPAGVAPQRPAAAAASATLPAAPQGPAAQQAPAQAAQRPAQAATGVSGSARVALSQGLEEGDVDIDSLLRDVVTYRGSDLHLTARSAPKIRRDGALVDVDGYPELESIGLRRSIYRILTQKQRETFEENLELDFAYQVRGGSRFRVNIYQQRDAVGAAFRVIPSEIKALEELGVPPVVGSFANLPRGLVLVTGPTGSGKSTTLAAIVDLANRTRADHIMTVEDPIEFLHPHKKSLVNQREVGTDTHSFAQALKHVLRQDPDVILIGELRDQETISTALTAAETGHLVFATLHTQDAAQTIDRVIDVFPPSQQDQIRVQLASTIRGVVCQTLCKRADGPGRAVATEIMIATPAVGNLIREGKTHQIYSSMQAGKAEGMHTMDQHLADLVQQGRISYETGLEKCHHVEDFNRLSGRSGGMAGGGFNNDAAVMGGF